MSSFKLPDLASLAIDEEALSSFLETERKVEAHFAGRGFAPSKASMIARSFTLYMLGYVTGKGAAQSLVGTGISEDAADGLVQLFRDARESAEFGDPIEKAGDMPVLSPLARFKAFFVKVVGELLKEHGDKVRLTAEDRELDAEDPAWMHVYGQHSYHSDAIIRGNRKALEGLKAAIDVALKDKEGSVVVFAADGEGYALNVQCVNLMSALGPPEYLYELEYEMNIRAREREKRISPKSARRN